jgi:hypothetical protein
LVELRKKQQKAESWTSMKVLKKVFLLI